jgi:phage baseplate assembly protein gpV
MVNLKNLIRIGTVSSINYEEGKLRVCFHDQDNIVTDELPMLSFEYEMPDVGETVLCLFLGNGIANGFCLGRYFYDEDTPSEYGKDIYFKRFLKDATLKYDRSSKTLTLNADKVVFNGNLQINGKLIVTGDATIGGISFLGHTHPYTCAYTGGTLSTKPPA